MKEEKKEVVEAPKFIKFTVGHGGQGEQPVATEEKKEIEHAITNTTRSHSRKG